MPAGDNTACSAFGMFLTTQLPVYDKDFLRDIRPPNAELLGYYMTGKFDAFSGTQHTFDRFKYVAPDLTRPWHEVQDGNCVVNQCDPESNVIGWGSQRHTYGLNRYSLKTPLLCLDGIETKTAAKEQFRQILSDILRPASTRVNGYFLLRNAFELAGKKKVVTPGLPDLTWSWDAGGYEFLNTNADPTAMVTPNLLQSFVDPLYFVGAVTAASEGFTDLEFHTDKDTFRNLMQEDPYLKAQWRFYEWGPSAKEYYKYGFRGKVGDYNVKVLQAPMRFNKISTGRYQQVFPYTNGQVTQGIGSEFNQAYQDAQYQISIINNPRALKVMSYNLESLNPEMPFMIRDLSGKWRFAMHDLGADCNGRPIENIRGNKGLMFADFELAIRPDHPEFLVALFHKRDKPCLTFPDVCNPEPYPYPQDYNMAFAPCPSDFVFTPCTDDGNYVVGVNSIKVDGNLIVNDAISEATLADLVAALPAISGGTWAIKDADAGTIELTGSSATTVDVPFLCDAPI